MIRLVSILKEYVGDNTSISPNHPPSFNELGYLPVSYEQGEQEPVRLGPLSPCDFFTELSPAIPQLHNVLVAEWFPQEDQLLGLHTECPVSLDLQLGRISVAMPTPRGPCSCSAVHGEEVEKWEKVRGSLSGSPGGL